jgi:hypothetical protein
VRVAAAAARIKWAQCQQELEALVVVVMVEKVFLELMEQ